MNYDEFLESKRHSEIDYGISPNFIIDSAFDYQKYIVEKTVRKGRYAVFLDTGLGKTIIQLMVAKNYVQKFNKPVLIITPLAVAFQFIREAEKFGIDDIEYSKDGIYKKKIVVCNYERLGKFDSNDFCCILLDESSILKNFNGAIKAQITSFMKKVDYRYLFTATPSPNDFIELGTSSEALGHMGYMDMISKFFSNNENNIKPQDIGNKFYLKPHATEDFFRWVRSWSISMRKPSDHGFDDSMHILPNLLINNNIINNDFLLVYNNQFELLPRSSTRLSEVREEQKQTIKQRCEKAVSIAYKKTSVYWCNFNDEGDLINQIDREAVQIKGGMKLEQKEDILLNFANGDIKRLITKPKITAFGLNWQHCNHTVYFPTFSYEQYYQAIRRFWRFGQKKDVGVDLVYSEGQEKVVSSLMIKAEKANQLFSKLTNSSNANFNDNKKIFNQPIIAPNFLKG